MLYNHSMPGTQHEIALKIGPISPAVPTPLFRQIVDGFKRAISNGALAADAPLPSFRKLAEQLLVSVITVRRAYDELEREGIIYRRQGLGTFVAQGGDEKSRESKRGRAQELIEDAIHEARESGLTDREVSKFATLIIQQTLSKESS